MKKSDGSYDALPQYLSASAVSLSSCVIGTWMSFTSVTIPKMMENSLESINHVSNDGGEDNPIIINFNEASWIASLFFIGNIFGCLAGGYLNQKLGTKTLFLVSAPISAVTWIMIAFSHEIWLILVARVISGIFFGVFQANGKVYNAEIAHEDLRGILATILGIMFSLGCMYTYVLGYFVQSWRTIALCQLVPCCLLGISVIFVPDSPYWLVEKGRFEDAKKSLIVLRGPDYDVNDELTEMLNKNRERRREGGLSLKP